MPAIAKAQSLLSEELKNLSLFNTDI